MKIVDDGVLQFTLPMPLALREVHVYALETAAGWVLIDSGFPSEAARAQLAAEFEQAIGGLSRIALIILTHFHPDHSGLAGWLQQGSGCPVVIHEADWPRLQQMNTLDMAGEFFQRMRPGTGASSAHPRELFQEVNVPITSPTIVSGGETFTIGGRDLDLVWTPGHTEGHLCVLDARTSVLFTGDHLLARITPHVGRIHAAGRNPLHDFEDSLALVERLAPRRALPAHEGPVEDVGARCREIAAHHQSRRRQILAEIRSQPRTAPDVAAAVFRGREGGMHQMLALTETEAHLEALVDEGLLVRVQDEQAAEPSYRLQVRNSRERHGALAMEGPAIVRRMRSIVKEQFSEIERMQAAHFLIENANRMAHLTRKPADEAIQSMADGEHIAGVLSRLAAEAYALGYSEAVAALFPGVESSEAPVGRNGRLDRSSPRSQDWPDTIRRFDRDQGAPDETPS